MNIKTYLKFKTKTIAAFALIAIIFIVTLNLIGVPMNSFAYPVLLSSVTGLVLITISYAKAKAKCDELERLSDLSAELIGKMPEITDLFEEKYQSTIIQLCTECKANQSASISSYNDMMDYYAMWAHQIKTPIASMKLNLQNEDSILSRKLLQDLNRIERYADMVMAYLRIDSRDSDLLIKEYDLDEIVKPVIRRFSNDFISKGLILEYEELNSMVLTDDKWLSFVIEQLISNSVKYTNEGSVKIYMDNGNLCIRDTGIGIMSEDLPRVFEKGYTGFNGHMDKRASGIGLYLCKKTCDKLGHKIWLESKVGEGTTAMIQLKTEKFGIE